jgi:hypothetical protein
MLPTIFALLIITFSGTVLASYFYDKDEKLLVRFAAGNVVSSAIFGLIAFIGSCFFGLSFGTVAIALLLTCLPLILLTNKDLRSSLKVNTSSIDYKNLIYYSTFFVLFYFFFERVMLETKDGIFTGGSQNLGDLPYHLGAIFSFTEINKFPPENPSFAGTKFTYPFIADFITACFIKLGSSVRDAMLWQNITLAFSLLVLLENFTYKFTNNKLAGKIAPLLLFFSGGLGFLWFAKDFWNDGRGFLEFIWNLKVDYTIRNEGFRFGNSLTTLFLTQRSLLFGMPITLIVLTYLWKLFSGQWSVIGDQQTESENLEAEEKALPFPFYLLPLRSKLLPLSVGLLAGTLPLIHLHSLIVLFIVSAFLFVFSVSKWREWIAFGVGVCVIAIPELVFAVSGTSNRTSEFFGWHFGWDAGKENVIIFYIKSLGIFIPTLIIALSVLIKNKKNEEKKLDLLPFTFYLKFYLPFTVCFLIANIFKLAPWEWDNIKVLIYWFVGSIPFVALAIAMLWEQKIIYKMLAVVCLICLISAGMVDVWRVLSKTINYQVFDKDAVSIAEQIKAKVPQKALILNAATYNSAIVLSGRRSFIRYSGHLSSHGIDYVPRENDVKSIYKGEGISDILLKQYKIEYVLISPIELGEMNANEAFFQKFPVVAESGQYKLYKIVN